MPKPHSVFCCLLLIFCQPQALDTDQGMGTSAYGWMGARVRPGKWPPDAQQLYLSGFLTISSTEAIYSGQKTAWVEMEKIRFSKISYSKYNAVLYKIWLLLLENLLLGQMIRKDKISLLGLIIRCAFLRIKVFFLGGRWGEVGFLCFRSHF